jgi:hypothetical protein
MTTVSRVAVGDVYRVRVPARLPEPHPLAASEGEEFDLIVTGTDAVLGRAPAAVGMRRTLQAEVELTAEQKLDLGLLGSGRYRIVGQIVTDLGEYIDPPIDSTEELTVPVRWFQAT